MQSLATLAFTIVCLNSNVPQSQGCLKGYKSIDRYEVSLTDYYGSHYNPKTNQLKRWVY